MCEGLGVAGDRLKIGGLGVDQRWKFSKLLSIRSRSIRSEKRNRETVKRAKSESSFGKLEQQRKSKMEQKADVTKTKLIEGYN